MPEVEEEEATVESGGGEKKKRGKGEGKENEKKVGEQEEEGGREGQVGGEGGKEKSTKAGEGDGEVTGGGGQGKKGEGKKGKGGEGEGEKGEGNRKGEAEAEEEPPVFTDGKERCLPAPLLWVEGTSDTAFLNRGVSRGQYRHCTPVSSVPGGQCERFPARGVSISLSCQLGALLITVCYFFVE